MVLPAGVAAKAQGGCENGPIFDFSLAVYVSDFDRAQRLIPAIRSQRSGEMADFLQQVLIYTRGYEMDHPEDQEVALEAMDAQIESLQLQLRGHPSLQLRLDSGNIMMNSARMQLLSGNVMRSAQLARAANDILNDLLEDSPGLADAYLSLGLYQYFAANENNAWGWIKRLLSLEGDKQHGRELIERAVMASADFSFEALRSLMMDLSWDRPDICRYVVVYNQLTHTAIDTIEHRQRSIVARLFCGLPEQGADEILQLRLSLNKGEIAADETQRQWLFEAELQAMAMQGQSGALREILAVEQDRDEQRAMMVTFSLARALDVMGMRAEAKFYYTKVAESNVARRYQDLAQRYLQQPYRSPSAYHVQASQEIKLICRGRTATIQDSTTPSPESGTGPG